MNLKKSTLVLILLVAVLSLCPANLSSQDNESVYKKIELYQDVLDKVSSRYVTSIAPSDLIIRSIDGMIKSLDHYSQLLNPDDYNDLKVDTKGRFGGIGIEIGVRNDVLTVIAPIEGTPAYKMGLQGGDRIIKIEGESTKGWTTLDAVKKLRGPKGTKATITIEREGLAEPFDVTITRDIIKVKSVPYYFMVTPTTGYLRLSTFSESSGREVRDAVRDLQDKGMESLILDLRYNPGGLLNQAIEVAEVFLKKGEKIVYTEGRYKGQNHEYLAEQDGLTVGSPMVVLINKYSASASEIVAGALQDHDRALIIGEPSFGKGSVQTLFELDDNYALRLTTAYYYTPSGRSIHKAEKSEVVAIEGHAPSDVKKTKEGGYFTDSGREVFGGGGIIPDIVVKPEELSEAAMKLLVKPVFFNFVVKYKSNNPNLNQDFEVGEDLLEDFYSYILGQGIDIDEDEYTAEKNFVKMRLEFEIDRAYWGEGVARKKGLQYDVEATKALEVIEKGNTLAGLFKLAADYQEQNGDQSN